MFLLQTTQIAIYALKVQLQFLISFRLLCQSTLEKDVFYLHISLID